MKTRLPAGPRGPEPVLVGGPEPVDGVAGAGTDAPACGGVTWRAMGIACGLMPLLALWVVQAELIWYTGHSTAISLFFHVTTVVFLLALRNRWSKGRTWTGFPSGPWSAPCSSRW